MRVIGSETEYSVYAPNGMVFDVAKDISHGDRYLPDGLVSHYKFLSNSAKRYLDIGSHPEYCTPPVFGALAATICEKAGVEVCQDIISEYRMVNEAEASDVHMLRRTTNDVETWGYHINMQTERGLRLSASGIAPLLAEMVGGMSLFGAGHQRRSGDYWISQRAHDIWDYVNEQTTTFRPLVNTRDEPHADDNRWRRLHVIGNDVLHSPWATWLRFGVYDLAVALSEARPDLAEKLRDKLPVSVHNALCTFASDSDEKGLTAELEDGSKIDALGLQKAVLEEVGRAIAAGDLAVEGDAFERQIVLEEWIWALDQLELEPQNLSKLVDWRFRQALITRVAERNCLGEPKELYSLDCMLDNIDFTGAYGDYARIFQTTLENAGWDRLSSLFDVPEETFLKQVDYYKTHPYPGRSKTISDAVKLFSSGRVQGNIDWHLISFQRSEDRLKLLDPLISRDLVIPDSCVNVASVGHEDEDY